MCVYIYIYTYVRNLRRPCTRSRDVRPTSVCVRARARACTPVSHSGLIMIIILIILLTYVIE